MPEPGCPPLEILGLVGFPIIHRVAPALPGFAEIVRRHTGNVGRVPGLVQFEKVLVNPHVSGVVGDVDWGRRRQGKTPTPRKCPRSLPHCLKKMNWQNLCTKTSRSSSPRQWLMAFPSLRFMSSGHMVQGAALEAVLQGFKQRVVRKPEIVFPAKGHKLRVVQNPVTVAIKGDVEQVYFPLMRAVVVGPCPYF